MKTVNIGLCIIFFNILAMAAELDNAILDGEGGSLTF